MTNPSTDSPVVFTPILDRIAQELSVSTRQVTAAVALLDEGATVPFIARYRKEATGGLDDTQLRTLEGRLRYLRELEERRTAILASLVEQQKLTPELEDAIRSADSKTRLEDLYAPHRPKKRSKAQVAREQGLEPLADALLATPALVPEQAAAEYVNEATGVLDVGAALDGARAILIERFSEAPELVGGLRTYVWDQGTIRSAVAEGQEEKGAKFRDYFDAREPVNKLPSHRVLALLRGRKEGILKLSIVLPDDDSGAALGEPERRIAAFAGVTHQGRPADDFLRTAVTLAWKARLQPKLENDVEQRLREMAEEEAIRVFGTNLRDLLLAAPAGTRVTMGLDPGIRTGVKVAVVGNTGAVVATATVFPHEPRKDWDGSIAALAALCLTHKVDLVAIGNGTASRETEKLVSELMDKFPQLGLTRIVVSEAGASVYSASELASKELPELDVTLRGAVSIARRLQDPLAELVKIEPRSIGVGQYQHDVSQPALARQLDGVVEDCVNAVGADVNTASPALLARISGLNSRLAAQIVEYRTQHGPFRRRTELRDVPRLGDKTFEQAAGFLRILQGPDVLDASAVHPEAYPVVQRIAKATGREVPSLIGDGAFLRTLDPARFADDRFGTPTVRDILAELEKPGRDPRPEFRTARFKDSVHQLSDLQPGMTLEGVVTNVANFGAFVDIGVHQDGLVHVSQLADRFVKDPRDVVKAGQIVSVTVIEVDIPRKRVALTMRKAERPAPRPAQARDTGKAQPGGGAQSQRGTRPPARAPQPARQDRQERGPQTPAAAPATAMSAAFQKLLGK
ncbi:30S ribosomal protein S1 [Luteitalea pratensis]|uniref:30S ribosomal protein S1 n=1 Tax=Luteitalea pratensis TaxID=1855912 RepID=A0A143PU81_LUTPR|nr:Tex family protein [Luteitalea pratensis]AMY11364.1 30S ribosomal protein S1 [Luteitalea pratensis]